MKNFCAFTDGDTIEISAIVNIAQIYRFDTTTVTIFDDKETDQFKVPSTEWLEEFTTIINTPTGAIRDNKLVASGYLFKAHVSVSEITIEVFYNSRNTLVSLTLSRIEAALLHSAVLGSIIGPYLRSGGNLKSLRDMDAFLIRNYSGNYGDGNQI
jgi:hypothetical protein